MRRKVKQTGNTGKYNKFKDAYNLAHPLAKDKQKLQNTYNDEWNKVKNNQEAYDARMVHQG